VRHESSRGGIVRAEAQHENHLWLLATNSNHSTSSGGVSQKSDKTTDNCSVFVATMTIFGLHIFLPIRSGEIAIRKRKTSVHEVRKEPICVIPKLN
jgi:hypothetical protein